MDKMDLIKIDLEKEAVKGRNLYMFHPEFNLWILKTKGITFSFWSASESEKDALARDYINSLKKEAGVVATTKVEVKTDSCHTNTSRTVDTEAKKKAKAAKEATKAAKKAYEARRIAELESTMNVSGKGEKVVTASKKPKPEVTKNEKPEVKKEYRIPINPKMSTTVYSEEEAIECLKSQNINDLEIKLIKSYPDGWDIIGNRDIVRSAKDIHHLATLLSIIIKANADGVSNIVEYINYNDTLDTDLKITLTEMLIEINAKYSKAA